MEQSYCTLIKALPSESESFINIHERDTTGRSRPARSSSKHCERLTSKHSTSKSIISCYYCKDKNALRMCPDFRALQPQLIRKWVTSSGACSACLNSKRHKWLTCPNHRTCSFPHAGALDMSCFILNPYP